MRKPELIVVLEHGTRPDDEPELRTLLGLGVLAYVEVHAVGQRADGDRGVGGQLLAQVRCGLLGLSGRDGGKKGSNRQD